MIKLVLAICILAGSFSAQAGGASADISIDVTIEPSNPTPPGTEGSISTTISNSGPDTATVVFQWSATKNQTGFGFPPLAFPEPVNGPCSISPVGTPGPGDNFGFWITYDVLPGESRNCTFGFRVLETTTVSQIARWEAFIFDAGNSTDDPNLSNNQAELLLQFAGNPDPVSVPAVSVSRLLVLAVLLGWLAYRTRRLA